jgi:hypothetical protein
VEDREIIGRCLETFFALYFPNGVWPIHSNALSQMNLKQITGADLHQWESQGIEHLLHALMVRPIFIDHLTAVGVFIRLRELNPIPAAADARTFS